MDGAAPSCLYRSALQDLINSREVKASERLPPIFPVVPYNSKAPWRALDLAELIEPAPANLSGYQPKQRYWLFEERAVDIQELGDDNAMTHIFASNRTTIRQNCAKQSQD
ncbi:hypothetical protein GWK36_08895 [Caldichromatium japonicum]|uniref:Uncharacterized protein n=1 Tax=Caldichromatium japonicum TaxID=2699430 RepID=A0A6G7VDI5_9GAMM|nr:hypothetical protein [Caldichromatium japonicum]QIK38081.1 hypothetical protein GWK36_08895 [Caldichromatium japonicum]